MKYREGISRSVILSDGFVVKVKKDSNKIDLTSKQIKIGINQLLLDMKDAMQMKKFMDIDVSKYELPFISECNENKEELLHWKESKDCGIDDLLCPVLGSDSDGVLLIQPQLGSLLAEKESLYQQIINKVGKYSWASHTLAYPSRNLGIEEGQDRRLLLFDYASHMDIETLKFWKEDFQNAFRDVLEVHDQR